MADSMAVALSFALSSSFSFPSHATRRELSFVNPGPASTVRFFPRSQATHSNGGNGRRRVWRRRRLTKKDDMLLTQVDRVPFLEEQERKVKQSGKLLTMDIERLLLSEDNRFDFINEVAAEANEYVENNRDEYGGTKKAILHVLSNRVNDSGFYRSEAYAESDPYNPGPGFLKEDLDS